MRLCWGDFQCLGILLLWKIVGQGPIAFVVGAGGGCLTFLCSPKGEHIVAALSLRPSVCPSVRPSIHPSIHPSGRPSNFCPEHISKSIEGNLMKLDTLIEGREENCTMQEP